MYYNRRLRTNNIYRCNQCSNPYEIRYLYPCQIIGEYIHDPCSIFNEKIVQVGMTSNPPLTPLPHLQPLPPMPPGVDSADFLIENIILDELNPYPFNNIRIQGNSIMHNNGDTRIILAPNHTYSFNWASETRVPQGMPFNVGGLLLLDGNIIRDGDSSTSLEQRPGIAFNSTLGFFDVGPNPGVLELVFQSTIGPLQTSAILNIRVIG